MALYSILPPTIKPLPSSQGSLNQISIGNSVAQVLNANPDRLGFTIYNNSSRTVYLGLSNTVSTTAAFFAVIPANSLYEWDLQSIYTGAIFAIASPSGAVLQVLELSA